MQESQSPDITCVDLFCGAGGIRLAANRAGLRCVFSSEIDEDACNTYEANFGERPAGDITRIPVTDIPPHDLLCAGFPCQDFSLAGSGYGLNGERGRLFGEIVRILSHHRPPAVFLENVPGFRQRNGGLNYRIAMSILTSLNYDMHCAVLRSDHHGCPTVRTRLYMVGFLNAVHEFRFPRPSFTRSSVRDVLLPDREAERHEVRGHVLVPTTTKSNRRSGRGLVAVGRMDGRRFQGYRVYPVDGPAATQSARGGGLGASSALYQVGDRVRRLAPRESARIMGFPDTFVFCGPETEQRRQIGNSVCVTVVEAILRELVRTLRQFAG
ncbi:MAG: DNA cytosine methyltransferase [Lentisphaerae bacterium]|nr:DNA cytosine methyltransferase [Lentisphaerota bacterium]